MCDAAPLPNDAAKRPSGGRTFSVYHFCVVCPRATNVFLMGEFNDWSPTATPMIQHAPGIWRLSLLMPDGMPARNFDYLVLSHGTTARSTFSKSALSGCWGTVTVGSPSGFRADAARLHIRAHEVLGKQSSGGAFDDH
jgi:1,4-alpha-glucan branching enzyme